MRKSVLATFVTSVLLSGTAYGAELPEFLSGGQTYATDLKACVGFADDNAPENANTLDETGIFGYEFGCVFVEFKPIVLAGSNSGYLVTASCGDDSGITRPDVFNISFHDGIVTATSQNDYVFVTLRTGEVGDAESMVLVDKQFEKCQPK